MKIALLVVGILVIAYLAAPGVTQLPDGNDDEKLAAPDLTVTSASGKYIVTDKAGKQLYTSTSGSVAVQWALDHLNSGRTAKEKVLMKGTFSLPTPLSIPSYTTLQLEGTATGSTSVIKTSSKTQIFIYGGTWKGASAPNIRFDLCDHVTVCGAKIFAAANFYDTSYLTVCDNAFANSGSMAGGWAGNDCHDIRYIRNTFNYAAQFKGDADFQGWSNTGIYIYTHNDGKAQKIHDCEVADNKVYNVERDGISIYADGAEDELWNVNVHDNYIYDAGRDSAHPGIAIGTGGNTNPSLIGNVHDCVIKSNTVKESGTYNGGGGIHVRGDKCLVESNTISNTHRPGLAIKDGDHNTFRYNTVTATRSVGHPAFLLVGATNNVIQGNTLKGPFNNNGIGILDYSSTGYGASSHNTFSGNKIESPGSTHYCIAISAGQTYNSFSGTTFVQPYTGTGIINNGGTTNTFN
jgi:hypothetical protein